MIISPKEEWENLAEGSEKKVMLKCDSCGKITKTAYHNYIISLNKLKKYKRNKETFCRSCAGKLTGLEKRGKYSAWNKGKKFPELSGENSPRWNGGTFISSDGYKMVYIGKKKGSGWDSYTKEHFLIAEEKIGRNLEKNEVIHHIDGDKLNNNANNLIVLSKKEHKKLHDSLQKLAYSFYKIGLIEFSNSEKQYKAHVKLRELLGNLEEDNQQPSFNSNIKEGSETSDESNMDNKFAKSAGHQ